jgi:hypothetical protein
MMASSPLVGFIAVNFLHSRPCRLPHSSSDQLFNKFTVFAFKEKDAWIDASSKGLQSHHLQLFIPAIGDDSDKLQSLARDC